MMSKARARQIETTYRVPVTDHYPAIYWIVAFAGEEDGGDDVTEV